MTTSSYDVYIYDPEVAKYAIKVNHLTYVCYSTHVLDQLSASLLCYQSRSLSTCTSLTQLSKLLLHPFLGLWFRFTLIGFGELNLWL